VRPVSPMRPAFRLVGAAALVLAAAPLGASGPLLFQHGGRPIAQVGAFVARASGAVAVAYNPAAVARLEGTHYQLGVDYTAPTDRYRSATGSFSQDTLITESPALYATWHLPADRYPFALGIGVDNRAWYLADWEAVLFPGRFLNSRQQLTLLSVHPVVAYELGDRWSVGGGVGYHRGALEEGDNARLLFSASPPGTPPQPVLIEVQRVAESTVDGLTFDVGLHYDAESWGFGLVYDTGGKLEGNGDVSYRARDVPSGLQDAVNARLVGGSTRQSFELPAETRTGFWVAPYPELRLELDLVWMAWSGVDSTTTSYDPDVFGDGPTVTTPRNWDDTLSARLGAEGDLGDHWTLSGGIAREPSPVPAATLEPGFARGDAMVYGVGMTYRIRNIAFDLAYSFHQYDDRSAGNQEPLNPSRRGTYESRDQVFGFSIGWSR
jgi:long-chain fatty acid transport protein